jgi:hypothetical protein
LQQKKYNKIEYIYLNIASLHLPKNVFPDFFQHFCLCYHSKVQIHLIETENVCSSASNKGKYTQTVKVASESTRSVPFVIIPMQHGTIPIEIKASTMDRNDGIRKVFKVVVCELHFLSKHISLCFQFTYFVLLNYYLLNV